MNLEHMNLWTQNIATLTPMRYKLKFEIFAQRDF